MSSPTNSVTEMDESTLNKKRGRAQSVEPDLNTTTNDELNDSENPSTTEVSTVKKTKLDEESVNTIRKNMKDMSTQDKISSHNTSASGSQAGEEGGNDEEINYVEDNDAMIQSQEIKDHSEKPDNNNMLDSQDVKQTDDDGDDILEDTKTTEKKDSDSTGKTADKKSNDVFSKFAGKSADEDDWGEFAEGSDDEDTDTTLSKSKDDQKDIEKQKYTFGASSGFGTKSWSSTTAPAFASSSLKPSFGGFGATSSFGSTSSFGGFKLGASSSSTTDANKNAKENDGSNKAPVVSFGSFSKAAVSPLAALATAAKTTDALSTSSQQALTSSLNPPAKDNKSESENGSNSNKTKSNEEGFNQPTFGESAKVKVPGVQPTEVMTGEEDENTIYQVKGKLFILEAGNWKERGVGTFRINMKEDEQRNKPQTRLVMRTDSVFRVILNLLLFEGMKVFLMQDKFVRFAGFETEKKEDGTTETKLVSYALRLNNPAIAQETVEQIRAHIPVSSSLQDDTSKA